MDLREWIEQLSDFSVKGMEKTGLPVFLVAMGFSLMSALFVGYLYLYFYERRATGSRLHRAFPLLGISITAIFIAIQFSLPLSLGLLGALSIVRFRTPIKEPEEIAFVMLVVATSLCCATFNLLFLAIILGAAVAALYLTRRLAEGRRRGSQHGMLTVSLPLEEYRAQAGELIAYLDGELESAELECIQEGEPRASLSYRFCALPGARVAAIQAELRALAPGAICDVYFDRPGGA